MGLEQLVNQEVAKHSLDRFGVVTKFILKNICDILPIKNETRHALSYLKYIITKLISTVVIYTLN